MTIPLLVRRYAKRASTADLTGRKRTFHPLSRTLKFRNPLPHPARTALLCGRLSGSSVRVFESTDAPGIQAFRPAILAGTFFNLWEVSAATPSLKALVVFSTSPVSGEVRDWLWNRFQVPCFEQLLDRSGQVVAEECEVHCGLHVLNTRAVTGMLTSAECDCGRSEPRLQITMR